MKSNLPPELYQTMLDFYNQHKDSRNTEEFPRTDAVIEGSKQSREPPTLVFLNENIMNTMAQVLQPLVEHWCKCKLERTAIYGIREYYRGNILRNHVDRVATHVISVIIQVDQDLGGAEDWLLEVIDYKGKRQHVKLLPGEMLLYESAKLIHGRPAMFKGRRFANAFMHFRPITGWDYTTGEDNAFFFSRQKNLREPLENLFTDLTAGKKVFEVKNEL